MAGATLFIASTKPAGQLAPTLAAWVAELAPEDRLLLLYGGRRLPSGGWPGVDVEQRAGASIYHLRALIPTLAQPGGWAVVLEDHCLPPPGWGRALRAALATASAPVLLAAVTNRRSTETWSWASYLFSFAFHWPPMAATPPGALVAGTAFRVLPADRGPALAPGDFEHDFLRRKAAQALGCAAIAVDHLQRMSRWRALAAHFHNGRATGAIERRLQRPPSRRRFWLARREALLVGRLRAIAEVVARHPEAGLLPPGTLRRTRWLAWAHLAGFAAGLWTGAGRSYWRLE